MSRRAVSCLVALLSAIGCSGSDTVGVVAPEQGAGGGGRSDAGRTSASDAGAASGSGDLPCDVGAIFAQQCSSCHGAPTQFGAPMPLVTWADLHAPAKTDPSKRVYERVGARIHDDAGPMPPPPNARLSAGDAATLDAWIAAGAPARASDAPACGGATQPEDGGVPTTSCPPNEHLTPSSPWAMPQSTADVYICYGVDVTRSAKQHVVSVAPRVANAKIVHHILLFQAPSSVSPTPAPCFAGGGFGWRLLYAWAPGGGALDLPPEAGLPEDAGATHYAVQVHYNNANALAGQTDTSGVDLCATDQLRANDADVLAFGTQNISIPPHATRDVTCSYTIGSVPGALHAFAAMPHMHKLGTRMSTVATASGGGAAVDLGHKDPFTFDGQAWLPISATLDTGDVVKTRCAWNNTTDQTVNFGENTSDEMCYSFTMYYPRLASLASWNVPASGSACQ